MNNLVRTFLLLAALAALFTGAGYLIGGGVGIAVALGAAILANLLAYWKSGRLVLSIHGAREVGRAEAPRLFAAVSELAARAGVPMPRLYLVDAAQPNAFATGRDPRHAAIAVTTGLLATLGDDELTGVLAHELSHVANRDTLTMTIAATLAGAVGMLANLALFLGARRDGRGAALAIMDAVLAAIAAPIAAALVRMAVSRAREYEADRSGALLTDHPLWLAGALERIDAGAQGTTVAAAERHPATAHLFILDPLRRGAPASLFATHPPIAERVRRLQAMAGTAPSRFGPWDIGPWGPS
jgi:heat shock protein HtpX